MLYVKSSLNPVLSCLSDVQAVFGLDWIETARRINSPAWSVIFLLPTRIRRAALFVDVLCENILDQEDAILRGDFNSQDIAWAYDSCVWKGAQTFFDAVKNSFENSY